LSHLTWDADYSSLNVSGYPPHPFFRSTARTVQVPVIFLMTSLKFFEFVAYLRVSVVPSIPVSFILISFPVSPIDSELSCRRRKTVPFCGAFAPFSLSCALRGGTSAFFQLLALRTPCSLPSTRKAPDSKGHTSCLAPLFFSNEAFSFQP